MLLLEGASMSVQILHPVEDAARLGTRYCTGGFIFQIEDPRYGSLMSGPTYPRSYNLYDGQGIPDAFQPHLPVAEGAVLGIGIGLIDTARNQVTERCAWQIDEGKGRVRFSTRQEAGGYELELERTITLEGRTLRSATRLADTGKKHVPFQWYPHPFFPVYPGGECCKLSLPVSLPENPGYELAPSGYLRMKGLPWSGRNYFQIVGYPPSPVRLLQKHPRLGAVGAACDYVSARFPIWGNENTFSFEPYYERIVCPGEEARWSVTYDF